VEFLNQNSPFCESYTVKIYIYYSAKLICETMLYTELISVLLKRTFEIAEPVIC